MSRISDRTALHAPLDELGSISSTAAAQSRLSVAFDILLVRTSREFSGAVQDFGDGRGGITRRLRFCTAEQMETAFRVTDGLVAMFAARKRVPLLDEPQMAALRPHDQPLTQSSCLSPTISEAIERQCRYHALPASHHMTEIGPLTG